MRSHISRTPRRSIAVTVSFAALSFGSAIGGTACVNGVDEGAVMGAFADAPSGAEQAVHQVCGSGSTLFGIDVSTYQGSINWGSVKNAGVKYAFIRVSDGANYLDSKFSTNWAGAKSNGIKRGAYQFFRSNQDPTTQANVLIQHMGALAPGDLPPVVDVETTDGVSASTRASRLHTWLNTVEAATGVKPIIYTGGYFWDDNVGQNFSQYPLWHAGYTGGSCPTTVSSSWSHWTFWQYSSSGSVSGISGNVDVDRFNGTAADLDNLAVGGASTPTGPTPDELEAIFGAAQFDAPGNTDIDGDGVSDVCARAALGMVCSLSKGTNADSAPLSVAISTTSFADANGWDDMTNYATMRIGDVTGDGKADVCARANAGVVCLPSAGDHFGGSITGPALSDADGWDKPEYYSTMRVVDVNGDGKADVCVRGALGFRCFLSTGNGFGAAILGNFFKDTDGFLDPGKYGTIRMADVDGDGNLDACARSAAGVECHLFTGTSWGATIAGPAWSDANGFDHPQYWSTLRFADLDGDGKADVCVRASDAMHCRLSTGNAFSATDILGPALSDANGWADANNYATIRFGDIDGDGRADLCARANAAADCWRFDGTQFGDTIGGPDFFHDAGGFTAAEEFRTFRMGDVDGDGRADLCARDSEGFSCFLSTGTGFPTRVDGPRWSNANGWNKLEYSGTFLLSGSSRIVTSTPGSVGAGVSPPTNPDQSATGTVSTTSPGDDGNAAGDGSGANGSGGVHTHTLVDGGCASTSTSSSSALAVVAFLLISAGARSRARGR